MAYGHDKIDEVRKLLKQGLSNRKTAEAAGVSVDFVKKMRGQKAGITRPSAPQKKSPDPPPKTTQPKPQSKSNSGLRKKPPSENADDKNHPPAEAEPGRIQKRPIDKTPEEIDRDHQENLRFLMENLMEQYGRKDFNGLKCTKITMEALMIGMNAERKLHRIESKGQHKDFSGIAFTVKGGKPIETEALPNQHEHDWPNPYKQTASV